MAKKGSGSKSAPSPAASTTPRDNDGSPTDERPAGSYSLRKRGRASTGGGHPKKPSSDASSLSSLSDSESDDDDNGKKGSDAEDYHDEEQKPQPVVVIKRKPGRPRKIRPPVELVAPEPERAPETQAVVQAEPASLPSPASQESQTSPPVRNLKRPESNPPPFSQPPPVPTTGVPPPPAPFSHHQPSPPDAGPLVVDNSTPLLSHILSRVNDFIQDARIEAGRDEANQTRSQADVEASIIRLPTRKHRSALCLTMNRYSAFCAAPSFDVPAFPITAYKVAIFLARASSSQAGRTLLRSFPQPHTFQLPLAAGLDSTPMGKGEGEVLSRELVRSWIEALGYAQMSTAHLWQRTHSSDVLLDDPLLKELLATFDTLADVKRAGVAEREQDESEGRRSAESSGEPSRKKTKWVRGGRAVDAPKIKSTGSPPLGDLSPSLSPSMLSMHSPLAGPSSASGPSSESYYQQQPPHHQSAPYTFAPRQPVQRGFDIGGYGQPAPGFRAQPTYVPSGGGNYAQPSYPPQHQPPQYYYSSAPSADSPTKDDPSDEAASAPAPMPTTRPPPAQWYAPPPHSYSQQQGYNPSAPGYAMQYSSSAQAGYFAPPPPQGSYYNAPPAPFRQQPPPGMAYAQPHADPYGGQYAYSPTTSAAMGYAAEGR